MLSLMLILHPRIGGPGTAAIMANSMLGLVGFALSILTLNLAVVPLGAPVALLLALMVSVGFNVAVFLLRRRGRGDQAIRESLDAGSLIAFAAKAHM